MTALSLAAGALALVLLPGGIVASLLLAVTLVLAAAVAGLMAYHYAQARIRERRGFTFDPEANAVVEEPDAAAAVRAKSADEIAHIRARIESLMEEQHLRSETQNQHLAQKLDGIRVHMDTQDRKLDGLKSELRHEIHRRDGELDELRGQLASALDAFWKAMPALPEGPASNGTLALPPAQAPAVAAPAPPQHPAPLPGFTSLADAAVVPAAPEAQPDAPAAPTAAPAPSAPSWADASTWAAVTTPAVPAPPTVTPEAAETPVPAVTATSPEPAPAAPAPGFSSVDAYFEPAAPAPPPPGADDLTVIRGIDEDVQAKLYAAGVHNLDEIARWSRADARRISGAVGVPEETIMHGWIFEAQSVLFDSYQRQIVQPAVTA